MYAAAGGASIANRRKQKRLQLNKRDGSGAQVAAARARSISATGIIGHHGNSVKLPISQNPVPSLQLQLPIPIAQPTYGFHSSHEHRRNRRSANVERKSFDNNNRRNNKQNNDDNRRRTLAPSPLSPIVQFPISPPPLSLESSNSLVNSCTKAITNKSNDRANDRSSPGAPVAFPFPPPSLLDLRLSPSTSELQCGGQGPGKAAWQGCARPSPLPLSPASPQGSRGEGYKTKQCEAHRRWMKRNRVRDASYCYGSSGEDDDYEDYEDCGTGTSFGGRLPPGRRRVAEVSAAVNTVLYAGLGTTALGLVISFVGTGEKGFLSPELRLVGPSLLCAGLLCCLLRVLLCLCLCRCRGDCRWRPCGLLTVTKKKTQITNDREKISKNIQKTINPIVASSSSRQGGNSRGQKQGLNASLLPVHPPSTSHRKQPPVPSSPSCSTAKSHKGHELLLSPAQLPE